jgi:hypothetical protein
MSFSAGGAMLEQLTSEPSLRIVVVGFIALCALMGFLRGIGRLVLLGLALAAGAAAAFAWLRYAPGLSISWWKENPEDFIKWGAVGAGLIAALLARKLLNGIVSSEGPGPMDRRARMRGGLLGLVPAVLLVWGAAIGVRWAGAASRLRHLEAAVDAQNMEPLSDTDILSRVSESLGKGVLGSLLNRLDPLSSREAAAVAALLVLQREDHVWARAQRHAATGPILLQQPMRRLRDDHDIQQALSFSHYSRLLALPEMNTALADHSLREAVLGLDMETVLPEVITGRASTGPPRAIPVPER